ncbi:MAG: GNAT family N-acetyltransferase [Oscillospiraceae bacterium]|nr:GNAT family N-acetyltransferase [Oscillospiraceae bacterium]MDY4587350.1 GNAT family N-acetyltransferase [Oscillospiraceae bacterium]
MNTITVRAALPGDMEALLSLRREMLAQVNGIPQDGLSDEFMRLTEDFFGNGDQTTVLAFCGEKPAGCATICWLYVMPTYSHPTGKRAHIMNVYTREEFRRMGAARSMMTALLEEAKRRGATSITLDATDSGRPLYEAMGFHGSREHMEFISD